MDLPNFAGCDVSFKVTCWMFIILPLIYFFCIAFLFQSVSVLGAVLVCNRICFPYNFLFLMWLSLLMICPMTGSFKFRTLRFLSPVVAHGLILCARCTLLCKNSRLLHSCCIKLPLGYPVRCLAYLWTIVPAKVSLCNQGGTASIFLSRLACHIFNLANKHDIIFIPAYVSTHLNVKLTISLGVGTCFQTLLRLHFISLGQLEVNLLASTHNNQYQCYYTFECPLPLGTFGLNAFNHPWTCQVSYVLPSQSLAHMVLFMFLAENVTGQFRLPILVTPCWMEAPLLHTALNIFGRHSSSVSYHQWPCHGCLRQWGAQWPESTAFKPLAAQRCVLHKQGLSSFIVR